MPSAKIQAASRRLVAAVHVAEDRGQRVPCLVEPTPLWLSENRTDRNRAALLCRGCPVNRQCAALADVLPASFGVWAGEDRTADAGGLSDPTVPREASCPPLPLEEGRGLRELAAAAKAAERRVVVARRARDRALWRLSQDGWTPTTLARAAGLAQSHVSTIVARERARNGWQSDGADEAVAQ